MLHPSPTAQMPAGRLAEVLRPFQDMAAQLDGARDRLRQPAFHSALDLQTACLTMRRLGDWMDIVAADYMLDLIHGRVPPLHYAPLLLTDLVD